MNQTKEKQNNINWFIDQKERGMPWCNAVKNQFFLSSTGERSYIHAFSVQYASVTGKPMTWFLVLLLKAGADSKNLLKNISQRKDLWEHKANVAFSSRHSFYLSSHPLSPLTLWLHPLKGTVAWELFV